MSPIPSDFVALLVGAVGGFLTARGIGAGLRREHREPAVVETSELDDSFERLVRSLPVATLTVDRSGRLTFVNPIAAELLKIDAQRALGRALIEAVPSVELERLMRRALVGENVSGTVVLSRITEDATISIAAYPIEVSRGAVIVANDQTKLIALERVRRDFISDVSHELRTPLSAIRLMVETVQLSNHDAEATRLFLPKVINEVDRMVHLVEDLLDLARTESGRIKLKRELIDLRVLTDDSLATFRPRAEAMHVALELADGPPVLAECDADRLTQVLVNLVDNALRHTRAGGSVRVRVEQSGGDALIEVADNGIGIPFHDLPHIFERFYVVERSRARESSGTGLGLSIVKQIIEAHGGTIQADSELGTGSTFVCRLPLKVAIRTG